MNSIPSQSREELEKLERKHAENPEGRYFVPLANAFRKVGEVDRAIGLLRKGLAKHPDYLSAHIVLGRCLSDLGEEEDAASEFRHVLALDPQNLIALRTLGELSMGAGRPDEARRWFQNLLAVDPMNEEARRALESLTSAATAAHVSGLADPVEPPPEALVPDQLPATPPADLEASGAYDEEPTATDPPGPVGESEPWETGSGAGDDSEVEEFSFGEDSEAVVTETIAELYTRQGVYDRAAEVYRELIRQRGPDADLERRLERVEAMARGESVEDLEAETGATAGSEVEMEMEDEELLEALPLLAGAGDDRPDAVGDLADPFADSFDVGFPGEDTVEGPSWDELPPLLPSHADSLVQQSPGSQEAAAAPTIRTLLRQMLGWTPGSGAPEGATTSEASLEPAEVEAEAEENTVPAPLPSVDEFPPPTQEDGGAAEGGEVHSQPAADEHGVLHGWTGAPAAEEDDFDRIFGFSDPEPDFESEEVTSAEATGLLPAPFEADDVDDLFPWELPTASPEPEPAPVNQTGSDLHSEQDSETEQDPEPETPEEPIQETGSTDKDDDLESFQAWLRSLKR